MRGDVVWAFGEVGERTSRYASETLYLLPGPGGTLRLEAGFKTNPGQAAQIGPGAEPPAEGDASAPQWLTETFFYDRKGRRVQTQAESPLLGGETTTTSTQYDFAGKALRVRLEHESARGSVATTTRYAYDAAGRRLRAYRETGGEGDVLLSESSYNALGERTEKRLHSADGGSAFLQHVDYRRNVRGWLTSVNGQGGASGTEGGSGEPADLFSMELTYAGVYDYLYAGDAAAARRFDGSVSGMLWRQEGESLTRGYGYRYDGLGRLTGAHYAGWQGGAETQTGRFSVEGVTYDLNGNLTGLRRRGAAGLVDDLAYHYDPAAPNRLTDVTEAAAATDGHDFQGDGQLSGDAYQYDANGNLTADQNKGIEHIEVGYLNLPERIDFGAGDEVRYLWAADGRKLRKEVYSGGAVSRAKHYALGGVVYEAASGGAEPSLSHFSTSEGRAVFEAGAWQYEYHLRDHLGNLRVAFQPGGQGGARVVQRASYYPYGLRLAGLSGGESTNEDLYNGKELEEAHGLRWYHYGARMYDPQTARWASMDPADEFHTPYSYVGGDPVNLVDPDGRQAAQVQEAWDGAMSDLKALWYGAVGKPVSTGTEKAQASMRGAAEALGATDFARAPDDISRGLSLMGSAYEYNGFDRDHVNTSQVLRGADLALQGLGNANGALENAAAVGSVTPAAPVAAPALGFLMGSGAVIDGARLGVNIGQYLKGDMAGGKLFRRGILAGANAVLPGRINTRLSEHHEEFTVGWTTRQIDDLTQPSTNENQ